MMNALPLKLSPAKAAGLARGGCWAPGRAPALRPPPRHEPAAVMAQAGRCRGSARRLAQARHGLAQVGLAAAPCRALGRGLAAPPGEELCPGGQPRGHQWSFSSEGRREAPGSRPCYETGAFICDSINQG